MVAYISTKKKLMEEINHTRSELIQTANAKGFTDTRTIKISQYLDALLNEYQKITSFPS